MTRGTTLLELLLALVLAGLLAAVATPPIITTRDRLLVALHARHLAAAHTDTRLAALLTGARAELTVTSAAYQQRRLVGGSLAPAWSRPGPDADGVLLTGPATPITFDSRGYSLGVANRTYLLRRGAASRQVVISRLGRLRILP